MRNFYSFIDSVNLEVTHTRVSYAFGWIILLFQFRDGTIRNSIKRKILKEIV